LISLFDKRDTDSLYTSSFRKSIANKAGVAYELNGAASEAPYLDRLLRLQFNHWLPDNMLARADKVSMAHGIEARVPFLDHELVEFAMHLPPKLKLRRLVGKYILRKFGASVLPNEVVRRKKMPFYVPIENYFGQTVFRDMMDDLLSDESVRSRGLFQPEAVAQLRGMMQQREFVLVKQVFSLMVLELWFRTFVDA
jgi:asparagine synthase (glutamine-hydrolysing)